VPGTQPLLVPLSGLSSSSAEELPARIGGKGAGLAWLARSGFPVPPTWILGVCHFRRFMARHVPADCLPARLLAPSGGSRRVERAAKARDIILAGVPDDDLWDALDELWQRESQQAPWGLAIRSSATCEDSDKTAMAGLAHSVIGARGTEQLMDAVRQVWSSAMLPRTLDHLLRCGIRDVAMAAVIQPVLVAEASGVLFTQRPSGADPTVWGSDERVINATLGLGAPVVDGAMTPDVIRIRRSDGGVSSRIVVPKLRALVVGSDGPSYATVERERAEQPALSPNVEGQLAAIANGLERVAGTPQDIEFVVTGGEVVLVQARAVVNRGFPEGGDAHTVWSRANVGEALPGAATPLTLSVARDFSDRGFRRAFGSLGCTVPPEAPLVANVYGRFYLNLSEFMDIAAQVPGLDPRTWLEMGGGRYAEPLDGQHRRGVPWAFLGRLPRTVVRFVAEQVRLRRRVERFHRRGSAKRNALRRRELASASLRELAGLWQEAVGALDQAGTLMLTCASASLAAYLALKGVLGWREPESSAELAKALAAGIGDLESALPGVAIAELAGQAQRHPDLAGLLLQGGIDRVDQLPESAVRRGLEAFMVEFGDRAVREAELATPRWR